MSRYAVLVRDPDAPWASLHGARTLASFSTLADAVDSNAYTQQTTIARRDSSGRYRRLEGAELMEFHQLVRSRQRVHIHGARYAVRTIDPAKPYYADAGETLSVHASIEDAVADPTYRPERTHIVAIRLGRYERLYDQEAERLDQLVRKEAA